MVSQFVSPHAVPLLGDIDFDFPEGTHAIGRLDSHSEGLLLLTTNKAITRLLFHSEKRHERVYLVKVARAITEDELQLLQDGVTIRVADGIHYQSKPVAVELIKDPGFSFPSPFTTGKYYENKGEWIRITLTEGKFHQVRKMILGIRHRCLRLVRVSIEDIHLDDLLPGQVREISAKEFFDKLHLEES